jgi:hypothetical protein
VDGILCHNLLLSQAFFRWESLCGWDFRPQLVVVSGLFGGNPFVDGILGFHGAFFHKLFFFSRWNSGYQEALLTNFFLFSRWNSGYQEAFLMNFFLFFSRWNSGYQEAFLTIFFLFSQWNSGYQEAFLTNFSFFYDGILAIKEPFTRIFLFS